MSRRASSLALAPTLALVGALALAGCSGGTGTSSSDSSGAADSSTSRPAGRLVTGTDSLSAQVARAERAGPQPYAQPRLLIATGTVELRARDVADARARVLRVVDRFRGEVAEQQSDSDGHGELAHTRLVVRIPSADFATAVAALEHTADLVYSDTRAEDVTTQVIDTRVDLRVQRRSIARVETLLDRARTIRDIVAIETQLSRRQARLGSLERRAAYLADQTAMSTVTISVERRPRHAAVADGGGFVSGLRAGWDALTAVAVVLATTVGAVLPFAALLLVLLVPAWPLVRRLRRRRAPEAAPAEA